MSKLPIRSEFLPHYHGLEAPRYETEGSSGMDLRAACDEEGILIQPGARVLVPTALVLEIPPTHEAQIRPRSGLALKHCVWVANAPGTIDSDYRGEIKVMLYNGDHMHSFKVERGMRIAQIVFCPVTRIILDRAPPRDTERGDGGFGSTGMD